MKCPLRKINIRPKVAVRYTAYITITNIANYNIKKINKFKKFSPKWIFATHSIVPVSMISRNILSVSKKATPLCFISLLVPI